MPRSTSDGGVMATVLLTNGQGGWPLPIAKYERPTEQVSIEEGDLEGLKAGDGSLPGGLSPEMMSKLAKNPEVMSLLANPKLQEIMTKVMEGGPEGAIDLLKDPESKELMEKLTAIMSAP